MADDINRMRRYTAADIEDAIDAIQALSPLTIYTAVIEPETSETIVIGPSDASYQLILSSTEAAGNSGQYIIANSSEDCTVCAVSASSAATVSAIVDELTIENDSSTDTIRVSLLRLF